jgi:hypothetical protein
VTTGFLTLPDDEEIILSENVISLSSENSLVGGCCCCIGGLSLIRIVAVGIVVGLGCGEFSSEPSKSRSPKT